MPQAKTQRKAPARKAPARKAPARKAPARRRPAAKAEDRRAATVDRTEKLAEGTFQVA